MPVWWDEVKGMTWYRGAVLGANDRRMMHQKENHLPLDHGWPQITEARERETADKGEMSYLDNSVCLQIP